MHRCCFLFCYFVKFCLSIRRPFWLSDIDLCFWSILCIIAKYCIGHWKQQDICSQKHGSILLPVSFWLRKVIYPLRSISHFDQFFNWDNSAPSEWWWENQMAKKWMLFCFFLKYLYYESITMFPFIFPLTLLLCTTPGLHSTIVCGFF